MVFNRTFAATGNENHFSNAGGNCLFNRILNQRLINHIQHFLGASFSSRQETSA